MSSQITATVSVIGVKPLLWHHFGPDTIPADGRKEKTGVAGNDPEMWKRCVLAKEDGQLFIEPSYVFGCIRNGAKYTKSGRGSIQQILGSTLQVDDLAILVDRYLEKEVYAAPKDFYNKYGMPVYIDVRSSINPTTRGRNMQYRVAASPGWKTSFTISWDPTVVARQVMEAVVKDSGKLVGLGSGRTIGMGRFDVLSFELQ